MVSRFRRFIIIESGRSEEQTVIMSACSFTGKGAITGKGVFTQQRCQGKSVIGSISSTIIFIIGANSIVRIDADNIMPIRQFIIGADNIMSIDAKRR